MLLNSHDASETDSLLTNISQSLHADDLNSDSISVECVIEAFSYVKRGKSDGSSLLSDHLNHALQVV